MSNPFLKKIKPTIPSLNQLISDADRSSSSNKEDISERGPGGANIFNNARNTQQKPNIFLRTQAQVPNVFSNSNVQIPNPTQNHTITQNQNNPNNQAPNQFLISPIAHNINLSSDAVAQMPIQNSLISNQHQHQPSPKIQLSFNINQQLCKLGNFNSNTIHDLKYCQGSINLPSKLIETSKNKIAKIKQFENKLIKQYKKIRGNSTDILNISIKEMKKFWFNNSNKLEYERGCWSFVLTVDQIKRLENGLFFYRPIHHEINTLLKPFFKYHSWSHEISNVSTTLKLDLLKSFYVVREVYQKNGYSHLHSNNFFVQNCHIKITNNFIEQCKDFIEDDKKCLLLCYKNILNLEVKPSSFLCLNTSEEMKILERIGNYLEFNKNQEIQSISFDILNKYWKIIDSFYKKQNSYLYKILQIFETHLKNSQFRQRVHDLAINQKLSNKESIKNSKESEFKGASYFLFKLFIKNELIDFKKALQEVSSTNLINAQWRQYLSQFILDKLSQYRHNFRKESSLLLILLCKIIQKSHKDQGIMIQQQNIVSQLLKNVIVKNQPYLSILSMKNVQQVIKIKENISSGIKFELIKMLKKTSQSQLERNIHQYKFIGQHFSSEVSTSKEGERRQKQVQWKQKQVQWKQKQNEMKSVVEFIEETFEKYISKDDIQFLERKLSFGMCKFNLTKISDNEDEFHQTISPILLYYLSVHKNLASFRIQMHHLIANYLLYLQSKQMPYLKSLKYYDQYLHTNDINIKYITQHMQFLHYISSLNAKNQQVKQIQQLINKWLVLLQQKVSTEEYLNQASIEVIYMFICSCIDLRSAFQSHNKQHISKSHRKCSTIHEFRKIIASLGSFILQYSQLTSNYNKRYQLTPYRFVHLLRQWIDYVKLCLYHQFPITSQKLDQENHDKTNKNKMKLESSQQDPSRKNHAIQSENIFFQLNEIIVLYDKYCNNILTKNSTCMQQLLQNSSHNKTSLTQRILSIGCILQYKHCKSKHMITTSSNTPTSSMTCPGKSYQKYIKILMSFQEQQQYFQEENSYFDHQIKQNAKNTQSKKYTWLETNRSIYEIINKLLVNQEHQDFTLVLTAVNVLTKIDKVVLRAILTKENIDIFIQQINNQNYYQKKEQQKQLQLYQWSLLIQNLHTYCCIQRNMKLKIQELYILERCILNKYLPQYQQKCFAFDLCNSNKERQVEQKKLKSSNKMLFKIMLRNAMTAKNTINSNLHEILLRKGCQEHYFTQSLLLFIHIELEESIKIFSQYLIYLFCLFIAKCKPNKKIHSNTQIHSNMQTNKIHSNMQSNSRAHHLYQLDNLKVFLEISAFLIKNCLNMKANHHKSNSCSRTVNKLLSKIVRTVCNIDKEVIKKHKQLIIWTQNIKKSFQENSIQQNHAQVYQLKQLQHMLGTFLSTSTKQILLKQVQYFYQVKVQRCQSEVEFNSILQKYLNFVYQSISNCYNFQQNLQHSQNIRSTLINIFKFIQINIQNSTYQITNIQLNIIQFQKFTNKFFFQITNLLQIIIENINFQKQSTKNMSDLRFYFNKIIKILIGQFINIEKYDNHEKSRGFHLMEVKKVIKILQVLNNLLNKKIIYRIQFLKEYDIFNGNSFQEIFLNMMEQYLRISSTPSTEFQHTLNKQSEALFLQQSNSRQNKKYNTLYPTNTSILTLWKIIDLHEKYKLILQLIIFLIALGKSFHLKHHPIISRICAFLKFFLKHQAKISILNADQEQLMKIYVDMEKKHQTQGKQQSKNNIQDISVRCFLIMQLLQKIEVEVPMEDTLMLLKMNIDMNSFYQDEASPTLA